MINFRLLPGDTRDSMMAYLQDTLPVGVTARVRQGFLAEPSQISSTDSEAWRALSSLAQSLPVRPVRPVAAPFLLIAGSDARHYQALSDSVYRFLPVSLAQADLARFHGPNERLAREQLVTMVGFYRSLLQTRFQ